MSNATTVYFPVCESDSASVGFPNEDDFGTLVDSLGKPCGERWKPLTISLHRHPPEDFLYLSLIIVSTERVWLLLEPYLNRDVEGLLLLDSQGRRYYAWNILYCQEGVLDLAESKYWKDEITGKYTISAFVFNRQALTGRYVFRIPEDPEYNFVTEEFKQLIERLELKKIWFPPVPAPIRPEDIPWLKRLPF